MITKLPVIPANKKPKVLLIGNGISRCFEGLSWDNLIENIDNKTVRYTKEDLKKLPYPLQPCVVTGDNVHKALSSCAEQLINEKMSEEENNLYRHILDSSPDIILTTNYTYEIEKALNADFKISKGSKSKYRKRSREVIFRKDESKKCSSREIERLYTYFDVSSTEECPHIWHIHGEAAKPATMILGHYYYGQLLSDICKYIEDFKRRYEGCKSRGKDFQPYSWIDYFMIGDVYTVGFGMGLSEMDLWWLANCKKLHMLNDSKIYHCGANIPPEIKLLADAYQMEIRSEMIAEPEEYKEYYYRLGDWIKNK